MTHNRAADTATWRIGLGVDHRAALRAEQERLHSLYDITLEEWLAACLTAEAEGF